MMPVLARVIITQGCWCVRVGLDFMILCLSHNRRSGVWSVCPGDGGGSVPTSHTKQCECHWWLRASIQSSSPPIFWLHP